MVGGASKLQVSPRRSLGASQEHLKRLTRVVSRLIMSPTLYVYVYVYVYVLVRILQVVGGRHGPLLPQRRHVLLGLGRRTAVARSSEVRDSRRPRNHLAGQADQGGAEQMEQGGSRHRFFMVGMAPHGLLLKLCETGMAALRAEYAASSATAAVARAKSPHPELVELSFHEVSGARLDRLFHLLRDSKTGLTCKLVASLLEPGRALSIFFQKSAEGQLRHGRAAMCDMAFAPTSGLIAALQYWSSFARGECRTVRMLWQHAGHPSIVDWFRDRPQEPIIKLAPAHPSRTIVSSSICL